VTNRGLQPHLRRGFTQVVGVGGIGTGTIFELEGNRTLGRNESRMGAVVDARDYCKLHIVEHYIAALLDLSRHPDRCKVIAVGNVGIDAVGAMLTREMDDIGIDTRYVHAESGCRTMSSVVFLYPDKSGGNITASNSAASNLSSSQIAECRLLLTRAGSQGIALCLPEVPLDKRADFLRMATECGSYRVASFASAEIKCASDLKLLEDVDLLALNREEAMELAGNPLSNLSEGQMLDACSARLTGTNSSLNILVTAGEEGAYVFERGYWSKHQAIAVEAVSTAGAGDALLAGTIAGLIAGMPLTDSKPPAENGTRSIAAAIDVGLVLAAFSVTSPHTIHPEATLESLRAFGEAKGFALNPNFAQIFATYGAQTKQR
jgi:sugar/nucleoside kinase (ribokinase family)